jgi:hypothetical protein
MRTLRLYCPAVVLSLWAVVAAAGLNGNGTRVAGLTVTALSLAVHTWEERRNAH